MSTMKQNRLPRIAATVLALSAVTTRTLAAEPFDLNLMQYEIRFGQGRTQHSFYLSSFAPGGRSDDLGFGENGAFRMPLFSTDPNLRTPFRFNASDGSDGSVAGNVANLILGIAALASMGYGLAAQAKSVSDAFDYDIKITPPTVTIPTSTGSSPTPAKK
jgi:hypothetical protein